MEEGAEVAGHATLTYHLPCPPGQFMREPEVRIFNERPGKDPAKPEASMEVKGHKLSVTRYVWGA